MTVTRRVLAGATAMVLVVGLLAACTRSSSPSPTTPPTGDEVAVGQFEELSGFEVPESATDVVVEPVPGSSVGALRARFSIPEADLAQFCGTPLPLDSSFTEEERQTFALPDDLSGEQARDCESMRTGTNVSRRVIIAPAAGEQVHLYVVAFEMPR